MQLSEALWLLGLPVACAAIGFLLGRLIRERPGEVERKRPRIAASTAYLRDAYNRSLSPHTRSQSGFHCVYSCCVELAEVQGRPFEPSCHQARDVIRTGLTALAATEEQIDTALLLADWVVNAGPRLPSVPIKATCKLARCIRERTIAALS